MRKHLFYLILFGFLSTLTLSAQVVKGTFAEANAQGKTVVLSEVWGYDLNPLDSMAVGSDLNFSFPLKGYEQGLYQLSVGKKSTAAFLLSPSEETISLHFAKIEELAKGMTVEESAENTILNQWMTKRSYIKSKIGELSKARKKIAKTDKALSEHYTLSIDSFRVYHQEYLSWMLEKNPNTLFEKFYKPYIRPSYQEYLKNPTGKKYTSELAFNQARFFDNIDFDDTDLLRSFIYKEQFFEYFKYYTPYNPISFYRSTDRVMDLVDGNDAVKEYSLKTLLKMFNIKGPKYAFQYAVEEYLLAGSCGEVELDDGIQFLADVYEKLLPGNKAPNLQINDVNDQPVDLETVVSQNVGTVLFYWSSHCKYCKAAEPELKKIYAAYKDKGIEFIGISLDNHKPHWTEAIKNHGLNWINVSDLKGWKSESVTTFKVHKTPYFYFLAKDMTIISKPKNEHELRKNISDLVD